MRTIKFRGKRKGKAEWVFGDLLTGLEGDCYIIITHEEGVTKFEVNPDSVGQYTGKKDANGKEIYEGDIIKHKTTNFFGVVAWNKHSYFCIVDDPEQLTDKRNLGYMLDAYDFIVIGNRFDNPELLKGGEEWKQQN